MTISAGSVVGIVFTFLVAGLLVGGFLYTRKHPDRVTQWKARFLHRSADSQPLLH